MIGQEKLKNEILNLYNLNKLPKVNLLIAPKGYGKKEFIKWFSNETKIPFRLFTGVEESKSLGVDTIREALEYANNEFTKVIYVFEGIEKNNNRAVQNAILKFLEEPPQNIIIFLLSEDKELLLPTIINRCVQFNFQKYTKEELKQFNEDELALEIFSNPRDLELVKQINLNELINDALKIIEKIDIASLPNALKLNSYIKVNDKDKGLYDINLFVKALKYAFINKYKETKDEKIRIKFNNLQKAIKQLKNNNKYFMDTFVINNYIEVQGWIGNI